MKGLTGLQMHPLSLLSSPLLGAGKGRGKKKKGAVPRPPPLLLVQDAEAALTRLQERVSALLLRSRAPSPPTPTRCPSSLPGWSGAAPLWQKSSLLDGASTGLSEFYTPELSGFITPWESATVRPKTCLHASSYYFCFVGPEEGIETGLSAKLTDVVFFSFSQMPLKIENHTVSGS